MSKLIVFKCPIIVMLCLLLATVTNAQKKGNPKNLCNTTTCLIFDKEGKWVGGFPTSIYTGSTIKWSFPGTLDTRVYKRLLNAYDSVVILKDTSDIKNFLSSRPRLLRVFQSDSSLMKINEDSVIKYFTSYKDALIKYVEELKKDSSFKKAKEAAAVNYFPGSEADIKTPFTVTAKNQYGDIITEVRNNIYTNTSSVNERISFLAYRENRDAQVIANHYRESYTLYKDIKRAIQDASQANSQYAAVYNEADSLTERQDFFRKTGDNNRSAMITDSLKKRLPELLSYYSKLEKLEQYIIQENREWIKCWLWLTDWEVTINPFNLANPNEDSETIALKSKIALNKHKINYLTKYIENKNLRRFENLDELKTATGELANMTMAINTDEQKLQISELRKLAFENGIKALGKEKQLAHYGEIFISNERKLQETRFHLFNRNMELANKDEEAYYWDNDAERVMAVNVPKGSRVSLIDKIDSYSPVSYFSSLVDPALDALLNAVKGNLSDLSAQFKLLQPIVNKKKTLENKIAVANSKLINLGIDSNKIVSEKEFLRSENANMPMSVNNQIKNVRDDDKALQPKISSFTNKYFNNFNKNTNNWNANNAKTNFSSYKTGLLNALTGAKPETIDKITDLLKTAQDKIDENLEKINYKEIILEKIKKNRDSLTALKIEAEKELATKAMEFNLGMIEHLQKWFSNQSPAFEPFKSDPPNDTLFSSYAMGPKANIEKGNKTNTYTIYKKTGAEKEEKVADWKYKRYSLTLFDPIAGPVFIINGNRTSPIYNATTQTFSTADLGSVDIFLGIKIIPWKQWIEDIRLFGRAPTAENIKRGKSVLNRLGITAGVGVQQSPLRNFFTGFSYDVLTGLSVNYGWNFYTKKDYTIKNGAVEKEFEKFTSNTYWGITISPVTLLKIFKIINLKP